MIKVLIWGIGGKMGKNVLECLKNDDEAVCIGGVDKYADPKAFDVPVFADADQIDVVPDVIIDFSRPDALEPLMQFAVAHNCKVVLATTGYSIDQIVQIGKYSEQIAIFKTANLSLGVNLMTALCRKAVQFLGESYDVEIIEQHHNLKVDSPSGTALAIAKAINEEYDNQKRFVYGRNGGDTKRQQDEIGIHAVRGGTIVGKHDVLFIGKDEVITISHEAQSKMVFAVGAVRAAKYIVGHSCGLHDMQDLIATMVD